MNRQIAIIGLGVFGTQVALSLAEKNYSVLAIDNDEEPIAAVQDSVARSLILDSTQKTALIDAGVNEVDTVVVGIGGNHLEASILTTALLREFGIRHIIARAVSELHERILRQVGATEIINPEKEMGEKLAVRLSRPGLRELFSLDGDACIAEIDLPPEFVGKNLLELDLRRRFDINVLGVQRIKSGENNSAPSSGQNGPRVLHTALSPNAFRFAEGDILVIMGTQQTIDALTPRR